MRMFKKVNGRLLSVIVLSAITGVSFFGTNALASESDKSDVVASTNARDNPETQAAVEATPPLYAEGAIVSSKVLQDQLTAYDDRYEKGQERLTYSDTKPQDFWLKWEPGDLGETKRIFLNSDGSQAVTPFTVRGYVMNEDFCFKTYENKDTREKNRGLFFERLKGCNDGQGFMLSTIQAEMKSKGSKVQTDLNTALSGSQSLSTSMEAYHDAALRIDKETAVASCKSKGVWTGTTSLVVGGSIIAGAGVAAGAVGAGAVAAGAGTLAGAAASTALIAFIASNPVGWAVGVGIAITAGLKLVSIGQYDEGCHNGAEHPKYPELEFKAGAANINKVEPCTVAGKEDLSKDDPNCKEAGDINNNGVGDGNSVGQESASNNNTDSVSNGNTNAVPTFDPPEPPVDVIEPCGAIAAGSGVGYFEPKFTEEQIEKSVKQTIWDAFMANSYTKEQTAAAMANIQGQSNFNPAALQDAGLTFGDSDEDGIPDVFYFDSGLEDSTVDEEVEFEVYAPVNEEDASWLELEDVELQFDLDTQVVTNLATGESIPIERRTVSDTVTHIVTSVNESKVYAGGIGLIQWPGREKVALLRKIVTQEAFSPFFDYPEGWATYGNGSIVDGDKFMELASSDEAKASAKRLLNVEINFLLSQLDGGRFSKTESIEDAVNYFYGHMIASDGTEAPVEYLEYAEAILEEFGAGEQISQPEPDFDCVDGVRKSAASSGVALLGVMKSSVIDRSNKSSSYGFALSLLDGFTPLYDGKDSFAFVAAMMRYSGYHKNYPVTNSADALSLLEQHSSTWEKVIVAKDLASISDSELKVGDVFVESVSAKHTMIYVGDQDFNDKKPFAMAMTGSAYPHYADRGFDDYNSYNVYRRKATPVSAASTGNN